MANSISTIVARSARLIAGIMVLLAVSACVVPVPLPGERQVYNAVRQPDGTLVLTSPVNSATQQVVRAAPVVRTAPATIVRAPTPTVVAAPAAVPAESAAAIQLREQRLARRQANRSSSSGSNTSSGNSNDNSSSNNNNNDNDRPVRVDDDDDDDDGPWN